MQKQVKIFRLISTLEALSYLLLLFVAMPLKYMFGQPEMVRYMGSAHGLLFVLYVLGAFYMAKKLNWSIKTLLITIVCSVLPFGPFYVERRYLPKFN